jgi:hypothetical protein
VGLPVISARSRTKGLKAGKFLTVEKEKEKEKRKRKEREKKED